MTTRLLNKLNMRKEIAERRRDVYSALGDTAEVARQQAWIDRLATRIYEVENPAEVSVMF